MADVVRLLQRLRQRNGQNVDKRVFRDRLNPLELFNDDELYRRFRFRRPTIIYIVELVAAELQHPTNRSFSLPLLLQVLLFLQFVASGCFHQVVGDVLHVSKATAGRAIRKVGDALVRFVARFIRFPSGQRALDVKRAFHAIAGFPNVLGCVDGTYIKISTPTENEPDYVNRKGFHSLNVQMVCDAKFIITNVVAKSPGSCHDSRIFRESQLCENFETGIYNGFLLGDSGYPCRRYLMTPYNNTDNIRSREKFNAALCRTRVLIEQTFGILKRRFPCLAVGLRTNPERACIYTVDCVILHNIGILKRDIVIEDIGELTIHGPDNQDRCNVQENGFGMRDHIANTFFG